MTNELGEEGTRAPGGSGNYALEGYDYQIEVSIWIALDLVMVNRLSDQIVLEPRSEEDLEADLAEEEPGKVTGVSNVEGYRLVVQAKRRSGDAWTEAGIRALLLQGKRRVSPRERLADENVRYVLVTNAAVNGEARKLVVSRPGAWPSSSEMPRRLESALLAGSAGRVAVVAGKDEERLQTYIRDILVDRFRVPKAELERCVNALRDQARVRVRGAGGGVWARDQIVAVIRQHDGYLADSHELDRYVYPANWEDLREMMRKQSAALLIGKSGTGKTMATRKLYEELREEIPGLKRVPITLGPAQLSNDSTVGPVLYDIEDPWGRFDFDPQSRPWNDQITRFFAAATPDRMIVATTRYDVAVSAKVQNSVQPWAVPLEAEHYRRAQRRLLYRSRIEDLPRNLQGMAASAEREVLEQLSTPLEIQKFFDELPIVQGDVTRNPRSHVGRAIERAHEESIEQTVRLQVEHRDDFRSASIVWALLKVAGKVTTPLLIRLEDLITDVDPHYDGGLVAFSSFFVAARNLRQQDTLLSYYHPRVEAGIVQALDLQHPQLRRAIKCLAEVLASFSGDELDWGLATAAKVVDAAVQRFNVKIDVGAATLSKVDDWVSRELLKGGDGLARALKLAAVVGSPHNDLAEFARFIEHRPDTSFPGFAYWHPPTRDGEWYERISKNSSVQQLVALFVKDVLVDSRDYYDDCLPKELKRLSPDVTQSFLFAARRIVSYGVVGASDVIVEGALDDLQSFEHVLDLAIRELTPTEAERANTRAELLEIENEVYSEHYAEHLSENDDGYTANEIVQRYVSRLRSDGKWSELTRHRHKSQMFWYWARDLSKEDAPDEGELNAAFAEMDGDTAESYLWCAVTKVALGPFLERMISRLTDDRANSGVWEGALRCLCEKEPQRLSEVMAKLEALRMHSRMTEIALELGRLQSCRKVDSEEEDAAFQENLKRALIALPTALQEVATAACCLEEKQPVTLSSKASAWLADITDATEEVRVFRLKVEQLLPAPPHEDITWLLERSDTRNSCVLAIELAVRWNMSAVVQANLNHRYARVTAVALRYLAGPLRTRLPDTFLDMARAAPSPVRMALTDVLYSNPQPDHVATLLALAADKWSRGAPHHGDPVDLPIALAAVKALGQYPKVESMVADQLLLIARDSKDFDLQFEIFTLLVEKAGVTYQRALLADALTSSGQTAQTSARALFYKYIHVQEDVASSVRFQDVQSRSHVIAAMLVMLVALRAASDSRAAIAEHLAISERRRVLLLLMLWAVGDSEAEFQKAVVRLLPESHPAVHLVLSGDLESLDGNSLDDLGDAQAVSVVLSFLKPKKKKTKPAG